MNEIKSHEELLEHVEKWQKDRQDDLRQIINNGSTCDMSTAVQLINAASQDINQLINWTGLLCKLAKKK